MTLWDKILLTGGVALFYAAIIGVVAVASWAFVVVGRKAWRWTEQGHKKQERKGGTGR